MAKSIATRRSRIALPHSRQGSCGPQRSRDPTRTYSYYILRVGFNSIPICTDSLYSYCAHLMFSLSLLFSLVLSTLCTHTLSLSQVHPQRSWDSATVRRPRAVQTNGGAGADHRDDAAHAQADAARDHLVAVRRVVVVVTRRRICDINRSIQRAEEQKDTLRR